jgi:hypothetical protein
LLSLAALIEGGRAIEVASSTFGSGTFLLNDSVPYNVVLRGTVPAVITAPNQTPAVEGPFAYIVYAEGTDIYGNLVRIEVARGQARNLRGQVIYDAPPVIVPGPPPAVDDAGPVVVEEPSTVTVQGAWTIPNDGTLFNIEDGYKLVVAVFKNPFTPSPPYPPLNPNDGPFPSTFAEFDLQREVVADGGKSIKIDVTPDIAINRPGAIYQAGQYRGKDVIAMATSWRNDNGGLENGRQSRPLRSNYSVDIYSIGLRLTTDPEFGGATSDDFRIYGRGGMAGDLAAYVADGVTQDRRVDVTSTPGPVPAYGIRGSTPGSTILETIRDYVPQAGDGFLDIGESVTLTTQELVPENYAGRYFVASEVQSGEGLDVNTGNNRFVSNADSKLEILETSSPAIEPVSAVSTQEGDYVKGGNGASDFGSVSEDGGVVAFVSRATDLLDSPSGGGGAVPTSKQQVFLKLTQSREVELISGPRVGLVSADADCFNPEVSADGRYVTYDSAASNILEGEVANGRSMIYVFDRVTRKTVAVSRNNLAKDITSDGVLDITGDLGNGSSFNPSISSSGRFVAFESQATNLDPPKVSATISSSPGPITGMQVLRQGAGYRPASTPAVTISSRPRPGSGSGASATSVVGVNGGVQTVSVSGGGSGYTTNAAPTVTVAPPSQFFPPGAEKGQVFLHDRDTDGNSIFDEAGKTATYLVSAQVLPGGQFKVGDNLSYDPAVSLDDTATALTANGGVYVAFVSYASNLPDASGYAMVYRAKLDVTAADLNARGLKAVEAVSLNSSGGVPSLTSAEWALGFRPDSYEPSINGNGRHVAFTSWGSNLVYNASTGAYDADTNQVQDVFVRDYEGGAPVTTRVSISEDRVATGWVAFASAPWRNLPMPGGNPSRNIPVNQPVAGDSFEIGDGLQTLKFVFDPAGGPGPDEVAVDIGANIFETRNNLLIAINSAGLRIEAFISTPPSENPPGTAYIAALFLRNKVVGEAGNVPIVTASANGVLYADGMSGGGTQATDAPVAVQGVPFGSSQPSIDRSGRFVAFRTIAENLDVHIRTDANNYAGSPITGELIRPIIWPTANVYVHDRLADGDPLAAFDVPGNYTTRRLSLNKFGYMTYVTGGQQGGVNSVTAANNNSPAISAGGRFVAFSSDSEGIGGLVFGNNNLQPLDTTRFRDVFLVDRRTSSDDPPPISSKPVVTLESPVDGLRVPAGSTISLSATAKPAPGKQISTVQFYINGSPFGAALTSEPYNLSYTLPTGGEYSVRVVATDSKGISSSDSAEITAAPPQGEGPSVAITQPSGANRFVLGSEVILNAFAKDSDGSVSAVKFFLNGSPLTATLSDKVPDTYVASFRPSVAGSVVLSATATDNQGNTSVSVPVTLSFVPASSPLPDIEILDFLPGTALRAGGEIPLRAEVDLAGADEADVTVQFVANGAVVGTATRQADGTYLLLWKTPASPGSFTVYSRIIAPGASVSTGEDEEGETYFYSALSSNFLTVNTATGVAPLVRITLPLDGTTAALNQPLTLRATAGGSPGVSEVQVTNSGSGYTRVTKVDVTNAGSGYTSAPSVTLSAPPSGGVQATAVAVLGTGANAGKVERVELTNAGRGYTAAPTVTLGAPPSGGVQATATADIIPVVTVLPGIDAIEVNNGGSGYTTAPTVTLGAPLPGGVQATAVAVLGTGASAGKVVSIKLTNAGNGYSSTPTVTLSAPPPGGVPATATSSLAVVEPALATAVLGTGNDAGKVVKIVVSNSGSGYTTVPAVTLSEPAVGGTRAMAFAVVNTPTVASVQFYVNGQPQGAADVNQPYETVFTPVSQGTYVFSAVAIGADGLKSDPDSVVVGINSGAPPVVTIENPEPDALYPPGTTIPISATAIPGTPGARIVSMQFFVDGVSLGLPDTQSPFLGEFQVPGEGPFKVVAVASDNFGNVGVGQVNISGEKQAAGSVVIVNMTHPVPGGAGDTFNDFSSPSELYLNANVILPNGVTVATSDVKFLLDGQVLSGEVTRFGNTFGIKWRPTSESGFSNSETNFSFIVNAQVTVPATGVTVVSPPLTFSIGELGAALPTVEMLPLPSATIREGSQTYLQAVVNGGLNPVDRVDFYANQVFIGSAALGLAQPNESVLAVFPWTAALAGEFEISARAQQVDPNGAFFDNSVISSTPRALKVEGPPSGKEPLVTLLQGPIAEGYYVAGSELFLNATAFAQPPATILTNSIQFFYRGTPLALSNNEVKDSRVLVGVNRVYTARVPVETDALSNFAYASAKDSDNNLGNSTFRQIAAAAPIRPLPSIDMLVKPPGEPEVAGGFVTLRAQASFPAGGSGGAAADQRVEFYANGALVGTGASSSDDPSIYEFRWRTPVAPGAFEINARAVDVNFTTPGGVDGPDIKYYSSVVSPLPNPVNTIVGPTPTVSVTFPTNGATVLVGAPTFLRANAAVSGSNLKEVRFYVDGALVGEPDASFPFEVPYTPTSPGLHNIYAVAESISGIIGVSTNAAVLNAVSGTPPAVSLIRPVATDQFFPGNPITMQAAVTVYGGTTVSKVDFYVNGFPAASDTAPPFEASYTPPAGGPYTIFARATDTIGNVTDSSRVTVTVSDINAGGSDPNQATVLSAYQKLLNRAPTPAENQYWLGMLAGGTPQSTIVMNIMSGAEYNAFQNKLFGFYSKLGVAPVNSTYLTRLDLMKADQSLLTPPANYPALGSNATPAPYGATSGGANAAQEIVGSAAFNAVNPGVQFYGNQDFMLWYFGKWPGYARGDVNALVNAMNAAPQPKGYAVSFINGLVYAANDVSSFDYQLKATSFQWLYFGIWQSPTVPAVSNAAQLQAFIQSRLGEPVSVPAPAAPAPTPAPAPAVTPTASPTVAPTRSTTVSQRQIKRAKPKAKARPKAKPRPRRVR